MEAKKQILEPVDYERCQAEEITYRPFQLGGTLNQVRRCDTKPVWVATETTPNIDDELCGAMSLCDFHKTKLEEQRTDISYQEMVAPTEKEKGG